MRFARAVVMLLALPGLTLAPMPVAAAPAGVQDNGGTGQKTLAEMIADRDRAEMQKVNQTKKVGGILSAVAGIGTALACGAARSNASNTTKTLCSVAGTAVAYAGVLITNGIAKKLVEKDQKKVLAAASQSLRTGEPQELALPDSSATAQVTSAGDPVFLERNVNIFYDTVRVTDLSKIKVIAEPYVVTKANTALRSTPSASGQISGRLPARQPLYVSGQVADSDWYMVSERVVEGDSSAMMAVGYVDAKQLVKAPSGSVMAGKAPPKTIASKDVVAVLRCDKVGFKVRDAKGKETNGTSDLCLGPEGTPITA